MVEYIIEMGEKRAMQMDETDGKRQTNLEKGQLNGMSLATCKNHLKLTKDRWKGH